MANTVISHVDQPKVPAVSSTGTLVAVFFLAWLALVFVFGERGVFVAPRGAPPLALLTPARLCGGQELCGLERFGHFGPKRGREYRSARPAARSQFLRSCFNGSYDTAAAGAGSDIPGADIPDTALDCAVSGATSRQINKGATGYPVTSGEIRVSQTAGGI